MLITSLLKHYEVIGIIFVLHTYFQYDIIYRQPYSNLYMEVKVWGRELHTTSQRPFNLFNITKNLNDVYYKPRIIYISVFDV